MKNIVIDANGAIVGRLGSYAAKELLIGNSVIIINSEEAIISGNRKDIVDRIIKWRKKGGSSQRGPKVSKLPDLLLKRMIRGMLPWDRPKGRAAWKRLRCYIKTGDLKESDLKNVLKLKNDKPIKFISLKEIANLLK